MTLTRSCPLPAHPVHEPFPVPHVLMRWTLAATAAAALAACGGGGGSEPTGPANQAPSVNVSAPLPNATFAAGAAIRIAAAAADSDGSVVRVEFYDGTTKLGEGTSAPYEFVWTSPTSGAHTVTVRAIDNAGAVALSSSVPVTVAAAPPPPPPAPPPPPPPPPNQPPTVSITAPSGNNFKPNAPATFTLAANAADADGRIAKVEFFKVDAAAPAFNANTLLGEASAVGTPPSYQFQTTQPAGTYTFIARSTDNLGATGTSASVQIVVNALPVVSLTAPAPNTTLVPGNTVTLRALASDADGSIGKLEFLVNGNTLAGLGTRVGNTQEYTLNWSTTVQGSYSFTARATDNDGAQQTTASVAVNVPANSLPSVSLDNPLAGTNAPTTLTLAAAASDTDGSITALEFFNGSTSLGFGSFDAANARYRLSVLVAAGQFGTYTLTARATDNLGGQRTTASKSVTIAANLPPTVSITSPSTFTLPAATVVLTANASDSDGIAKVEFFNGSTKLGESAAPPYRYTWTNAVPGNYAITARATDGVGSVTPSAVQNLVVATDALTMACADGALTQCSGDTLLRSDNGVGLTRSGVQAYGRSTSDLLTINPTPSTAKGLALTSGGVAELRLRRDTNNTPGTLALLLDNFGISWNGSVPRPRVIETFDPTAGRVQLSASGALASGPLPVNTNLGFYDYATLGVGATAQNYANNRYFPRAWAIRCIVGEFCVPQETTGPTLNLGDWRTTGNDPDHLSATRFHEDGDVHAGNGLPDALGNPTWLIGGSGFGVPMPGSKGVREVRNWSYRYANLANWFSQDTVNIAEWGAVNEHAKNRRGFAAYGEVTAPASVPTGGTVSYVGVTRGLYTADGTTDPIPVMGNVSVSINFSTRSVTITIDGMVRDDNTGVAVPLATNSTAELRTSGEANYFSGTAAGTALAGGLGGRLFGPVGAGGSGTGPQEMGAAFTLSNATTKAVFIGGIVARRQ